MTGFSAQFQVKFKIDGSQIRFYVEHWNQTYTPTGLSFNFWYNEEHRKRYIMFVLGFLNRNNVYNFTYFRCDPGEDCHIPIAQNPSSFVSHVINKRKFKKSFSYLRILKPVTKLCF